MSPWRDHIGNFCPVHDKAMVRVHWANGILAAHDYAAGTLRWSRRGESHDIASYQVTSTKEVE